MADEHAQQPVRESIGDMEETIEELQAKEKELDRDIAKTKKAWETVEHDESIPTVAGDWRETDDASGGEDPKGAARRDQDARTDPDA